MTIRISPEGRNALRKAITNHANWDSYRKANGLSLATMARDDYLNAARNLGLDARAIIDHANSEDGKTDRVFEQRKIEQAKRVFDDPAPFRREPAPEVSTIDGPATAPAMIPAPFPLNGNGTPASDVLRASEAPKANGHAPIPTDSAGKLMALIAEIAGTSVNPDQVREIVKAEIEKALIDTVPTVRIELTRDGVKLPAIEGQKHPEFSALLRAATARDVNGYVVNMWLAGPAGSGKTFAARQVSKALGIAFHYNGAIGMSHELLGFIDANGLYHRTPFREAYENGGVYLFDEVDGSDNAALLALNAALANNVATFPDGQVERHADCIIMAAANTWGFGGTSDYVGRSKIDAAFLSRFPARFDWQYDETLERNICGNEDFARRVQRSRAAAKSAGLKVLITPRDSIAGAALIAAGFTPDEAAQRTYLANLSPEQKRMVS